MLVALTNTTAMNPSDDVPREFNILKSFFSCIRCKVALGGMDGGYFAGCFLHDP